MYGVKAIKKIFGPWKCVSAWKSSAFGSIVTGEEGNGGKDHQPKERIDGKNDKTGEKVEKQPGNRKCPFLTAEKEQYDNDTGQAVIKMTEFCQKSQKKGTEEPDRAVGEPEMI